GGASRAAYRIHKALTSHENNRIISSMRVLNKFSRDNSVKGGIAENSKFRFILQKNTNKVARFVYSLNYPTENVYSLAWPSTGMGAELNKNYKNGNLDIVNIHYLADNTISIKEIGRLKMPLVWRLNDQWPFCSCEHYANEIDPYTKTDLNLEYISGYKSSKFNFSFLNIKKLIWLNKKNSWGKTINIVAPSNWIAKCAKKSYLFKNQPIRVIPSAINLDFWKPIEISEARNKLNIPINKKVILFGALGGTLDFRKGGDLLIKALCYIKTIVSENFLQSIQLVIFGQEKPSKELINGYEIKYTGEIKEDRTLKLLYSASDIFILPSRQDNLPGTGIESQACGTPVIAFNKGGLEDIVDENITGYLVKPFDYKLLAKKILWILGNYEKKKSMSEASIQRALDLWDEKKISKKYADLYQEIVFGNK
ncbi:glycosyltransferase, partial [Prochlorococcus sp. AH-716-E17]|nr:glycosyltransferase [Prochlorococcus sp. AH-716-E17]